MTTAVSADLIPEWLTAVFAALAVLVAFTVFRSDLTQRRKTDSEAQARLFDVWVEEVSWILDTQPGQSTNAMLRVQLGISNLSGQSIRGVDGGIEYRKGSFQGVFQLGVVGPTAPGIPERRRCDIVVTTSTDDAKLSPQVMRGLTRLDYGFTDASGNRWHRTNEGELRLLYNLSARRRYLEGSRLYRLGHWGDGPHRRTG